ncbi:MAG: hypothetical protein DMG18_15485 [Acidobacteria bacterium]|nr:MAG: hypothetical protein DMG18_15485 [Acidobacteriota bacterium]
MAQIFDDPMKSPLLEAFSKMPASISEADQTNLKNRAVRTYKEPLFLRLQSSINSSSRDICPPAGKRPALLLFRTAPRSGIRRRIRQPRKSTRSG